MQPMNFKIIFPEDFHDRPQYFYIISAPISVEVRNYSYHIIPYFWFEMIKQSVKKKTELNQNVRTHQKTQVKHDHETFQIGPFLVTSEDMETLDEVWKCDSMISVVIHKAAHDNEWQHNLDALYFSESTIYESSNVVFKRDLLILLLKQS